MDFELRSYRPADLPDVIEICRRTGADGDDATGLYDSDELLAAVYATPYVLLEPELAVMLDDGCRAVGYVLGTADTVGFIERYRRDHLPVAAEQFPLPAADATGDTAELVRRLHRPEHLWRPEYDGYPAHLHIDLLPAAQGGGHGRALINAFLDALRGRDVPGVHLGVSPANTRAQGFYERLGFHRILDHDDPGAVMLGLRLD